MKRYDEAIKCYDKIIEICKKDPYSPRISSNEAIEAIKGYDKAIKKNPDRNNNTDLWYNKGLFHEQERLEKALEFINKALSGEPKYAGNPYV